MCIKEHARFVQRPFPARVGVEQAAVMGSRPLGGGLSSPAAGRGTARAESCADKKAPCAGARLGVRRETRA